MDLRLLNNLPIENLTKENDYLGIIEKGDLIKMFLKGNKEQFSEIKMFALYGEWGSGKSTLMKYLQKELKQNFNTFFFDTWEFETDNNLSLSLLEFLISEITSAGEKMAGELIGVAEKLLKGFTKSVRISFPGLSIDGKTLTEELESEKEKTFLQLKKEFKIEFVRFEDKIKAETKKEYNIIFIDDLDRCEPENVLNLLSALKLFFTYGQRTIFFCGVDKKAINEAVKSKYNEVVKANEYLEKIFDISFSMPKNNNINKLIERYFSATNIDNEEMHQSWPIGISIFFNAIEFTNPRRLKKVLNKFQILRSVRNSNNSSSIVDKIPNINLYEGDSSSFFETILTLYLIILHEFYPDIFENIFNLEKKSENYQKAMHEKSRLKDTTVPKKDEVIGYLSNSYLDRKINSIDKSKIDEVYSFSMTLSPINLIVTDYNSLLHGEYFEKSIPESRSIDYLFYRYYIINQNSIFISCKNLSTVTLNNLKSMVSHLL